VGAKVSEVSESTIKSHESIKNEVKKLNLPDGLVETILYSVSEECSYDTGKRVCKGFRVRLATRFETSDIPKLSEVISIASKFGAEEVSDLQTFVSPKLMQKEREGCLQVATQNAESKAKKIASGAGVQLGKVKSVTETQNQTAPWPISPLAGARMAMASSDSVGGASIDSKPVDVTVSVSAIYSVD
jgi:uncharacterized protein YggE